MPRNLPRPHERLEISEPCSAEWDSMMGNERVRFCAHCRLHVQNLSEITPKQALELVRRSGGRLCLRIERDLSGSPRTRALAAPLYQIGRRASRLAAGAFGAALTLCSTAAAQTQPAAPEPARQQETRAARASEAERGEANATATASLVGTVLDPNDAVIPSAGVTLTNVETGARLSASADDEGAFRFDALPAGTYSLRVESPGFKAYEAAGIQVQEGAEQRTDARLDVGEVTMGVVVVAEPVEPLVKAASDNDLGEVRRLLLFEGADVNVVDENLGVTALSEAYHNGNREMVRELLSRGARVNLRLSYKQTALMRIGEETTADVVRDLLEAGARVNLRDEDGDTALMSAAQHGRQEVVELLLGAGAKVNARNKKRQTALMKASAAGATETVRALINAGADISLRDEEGHTALWYARDNDEDDAASLLLAYGAYEDPTEAKPETPPDHR